MKLKTPLRTSWVAVIGASWPQAEAALTALSVVNAKGTWVVTGLAALLPSCLRQSAAADLMAMLDTYGHGGRVPAALSEVSRCQSATPPNELCFLKQSGSSRKGKRRCR